MALQHLRSNTASKRPTPASMADGQLAINTNATSAGLFFKDAAGDLVKVGPVHVGTSAPNSSPAGSSGNALGEQWLDTSGGGYVFKVWDGSAWRSEPDQFVDVTGDTMTGNLTVPSLNTGPLSGFRNQIINGDFLVWQRGNAGYNNAGATLSYKSVDRWGIQDLLAGIHLAQSNTAPTGFPYSATIDGQTNATVRHRIELYDQKPGPFVAGSQWTLSVWANNQIRARVQDSDGNTSLPMANMTATSETSNGFTRYAETFTMAADASTNHLEVALQNQNGVLMRIAGVQLEPGPVATPFEHRPIGTELALCQRYFYKGDSIFACAAGLSSFSSSKSIAQLFYPTTMRATPTLSGETYSNSTEAQTPSIGKDRIVFIPNPTSGTNNALVANYELEAEL